MKPHSFTLSADEYGAPWFDQAELVLVCRKRMSVPMEEERIPADVREKQYHGDYHEMYWGEIVEALKKV